MGRLLIVTFAVYLAAWWVAAMSRAKALNPSASDTCALCGERVAGRPELAAQIAFNDGSVAFFDGPGDMCRYYLSMERSDVRSIYVTDYNELTFCNGYNAYYVIGSDGAGSARDVTAFRDIDRAREFAKSRRGARVVRFTEAAPAIIGEVAQ